MWAPTAMRYRFADFVLDCDRYELRRGAERLEVQPKVWALLRLLAEHAGRTLPKEDILDALWPDVVVGEGSLQRLASLARQALARGGGEALVKTVHGVGYRLDAEVVLEGAGPAPRGGLPGRPAAPASAQEIHFCETVDGVPLAWSRVGQGPPLVRCLGWFTNLEMEWQWPEGRALWERLARHHTLVRYDGRSMGLSGSHPRETRFTLETRLRDLEAVVEAAGLERFSLAGFSEGCAAAVRYAARYPGRVEHLVLYGPSKTTAIADWTEEDEAFGQVIKNLCRLAWGGGARGSDRMLAQLFLGAEATAEMVSYFQRMQRASADRDTAVRYIASTAFINVSEDARAVKAPTLVVHRRDDALCPFEAGRQLAALIPGARLLPMEGSNHWLLVDDPGAPAFVDAVEIFLRT